MPITNDHVSKPVTRPALKEFKGLCNHRTILTLMATIPVRHEIKKGFKASQTVVVRDGNKDFAWHRLLNRNDEMQRIVIALKMVCGGPRRLGTLALEPRSSQSLAIVFAIPSNLESLTLQNPSLHTRKTADNVALEVHVISANSHPRWGYCQYHPVEISVCSQRKWD